MSKKETYHFTVGTDNDPITGYGCVGSGNDRGPCAGDAYGSQHRRTHFLHGSCRVACLVGRWLRRLCE